MKFEFVVPSGKELWKRLPLRTRVKAYFKGCGKAIRTLKKIDGFLIEFEIEVSEKEDEGQHEGQHEEENLQ